MCVPSSRNLPRTLIHPTPREAAALAGVAANPRTPRSCAARRRSRAFATSQHGDKRYLAVSRLDRRAAIVVALTWPCRGVRFHFANSHPAMLLRRAAFLVLGPDRSVPLSHEQKRRAAP